MNSSHRKCNSPRDMSDEMMKYFEHVKTHNPDLMGFGLGIAGHANDPNDPKAGTHVCSFAAGPPDKIAEMIIMLIDKVIDVDPSFSAYFLLAMMARAKRAREEATGAILDKKFNNVGGEDAEQTLAKIMESMGIPVPPKGNQH